MGDSDDDTSDHRRGRDKFRRERQDTGDVVGMGSVSNNNVCNPQMFPQRGGNTYQRGSSQQYGHGSQGYRIPAHDCDGPSMKRPRDYSGGGDFGGEDRRKRSRHNDEPPNSRGNGGPSNITPLSSNRKVNLTAGPMLTLKQFLMTLDDHINDDEAMVKYREYKQDYVRQQLKTYFQEHKNEPWFMEKYHPKFRDERVSVQAENIRRRLQVFMLFVQQDRLPKCGIEVSNATNLVRFLDSVVILLEGGTEADLEVLDKEENGKDSSKFYSEEGGHVKPRPLHKTNSIYLRTLAPTLSRQEIEEVCRAHPGFKRLALQDPQPDNKFCRRGWATYSVFTKEESGRDNVAPIKEICWKLNNVRIKDTELGAIVNKELSQRVRPVSSVSGTPTRMRNDLVWLVKLTRKLDARQKLWLPQPVQESAWMASQSGNPLLVDESLLTRLSNVDSMDGDGMGRVQVAVDRLVLYLRIVHSVDFYSAAEYAGEDDMPHKCGIIHARASEAVSTDSAEIEEYVKSFEEKLRRLLDSFEPLSETECKKLGLQNVEQSVEAFIKENIQEISQDRWLCPLSGKKFKGPEFVRKHILTKHTERLEAEKYAVVYLNNYISDPHRPQPPPPAPAVSESTRTNANPVSTLSNTDTGPWRSPSGGERGGRAVEEWNSEPRRYGPRGNFYPCGGQQPPPFRSREAGMGRGRYSDRAINSYVDLDAPPKD